MHKTIAVGPDAKRLERLARVARVSRESNYQPADVLTFFDGFLAGLANAPATQEQIENEDWAAGHSQSLIYGRLAGFQDQVPSTLGLERIRELVRSRPRIQGNNVIHHQAKTVGKTE